MGWRWTAVVDLDTGVDAGHPDFDYLEPWTGEKVIYSAKWNGVWTETRNSDTSSDTEPTLVGPLQVMVMPLRRRAGVAKGGQMVALVPAMVHPSLLLNKDLNGL